MSVRINAVEGEREMSELEYAAWAVGKCLRLAEAVDGNPLLDRTEIAGAVANVVRLGTLAALVSIAESLATIAGVPGRANPGVRE